jgi:tape measure domain-containing protein
MDKNRLVVILTAKDDGLSSGVGKATKGINVLRGSIVSANKEASNLSKIGYTILGAFAVNKLASYGGELLRIADQYAGIDARLKLVSDSADDFLDIQNGLYKISQDTGTLYSSNADSYAKLATAFRDIGADSKETLSATEMINKSLIINGSNSEMASSFMMQFAQAMGSGVLQGDEFRAMLESNSYFAKLLAKALDTNIAGLREMSKDGKLTSNVLRSAFPKMVDEINQAFGEMPKKVDMAMNEVSNAFGRVINETNKATGGTSKVAEAISELARTIEQNGPTIREFFADTANLAAKSLDFVARFLNTFQAFRDLTHGTISAGDYFRLSPDQQRAYGSIRTELQMINGLQTDIANASRALSLHERFSIFYNDESLAAEKAEISEMESYVDILRTRIVEKTKKFGDGFQEVGGQGKKAFEKAGDAADKSAEKQVKVTGAALDTMKKKYQQYADDVKRLQDDIANREQTLADRLREMDRSGMSDSGAWQDRKAQAEEYAAAAMKAAEEARQAFQAGDQDTGQNRAQAAVALYDKASEAAADLNREVREGENVITSQQQNLATARSMTEEYGKAAIAVQQELQKSLAKTAQELDKQSGGQLSQELPEIAKQFNGLSEQAKDLANSAKDFNESWNLAWNRATLGGKEAIAQLEKDLKELTKDRHIKIYVEEVEKKAVGGVVHRLSRGGKLPGYGGGDSVRALLEPGEFVVRKEAVSKYGIQYLQALNAMRLNDFNLITARIGGLITGFSSENSGHLRFNQGGLAGGSSQSGTINVNLNLPTQGNPIPFKLEKQHVREFLRQMENMHRRSSR